MKKLCFYLFILLTPILYTQEISTDFVNQIILKSKSNPDIVFKDDKGNTFGQTSWGWLNPLPQGNSLYGVKVFDANNVFAAGGNGTFVRTTNGGNTWIIKYDALGDGYSVSKMFFINDSTGFILAYDFSTLYDANKIFKTTNSGNNWFPIYSDDYSAIDAFFVLNENELWMTSYNFFYKSTDGGYNWNKTTPIPNVTFKGIYFISSQIGWAVGYNNLSQGVVYKTTNGGTDWIQQTIPATNQLMSCYFSSPSTGYAAGFQGKIIKTTNGGDTWTLQSVAPSWISFWNIKFLSSNVGLAVGSGVYKTTNAGDTWMNIGSFGLITAFDFVNATGYMVGTSGFIGKSEDTGDNWTRLSGSLTDQLTSIDFPLPDKGWVAGYSVYSSTNGGVNWNKLPIYFAPKGISFNNSQNGISVGGTSNGLIIRTTNGGSNWNNITTGYLPMLKTVLFQTSSIAFAAGDSGTIIKSIDGGNNWTIQPSGTFTNLTSIFLLDELNGYITGFTPDYNTRNDNACILKTTNGGDSWVKLIDTIKFRYTDVFFTSEDVGWVTGIETGNYYRGILLKTTNGGSDWNIVKYVNNYSLNSVFFISSTVGWVAGDNGFVIRTTDGGNSWIQQAVPSTLIPYDLKFFRNGSGYIGYMVGSSGNILVTAISPLSVRTWTWTGAQDSSWNNPNNWDPVGVPLPGDSIIIAPAVSNPAIYETQQQLTVSGINILSGGRLRITDALANFQILGDIRIRGTLQLGATTRTTIWAGRNWLLGSGKDENIKLSNDEGFIPGKSTVAFKGTGEFSGAFYNLTLDTNAVMSSKGNVYVSDQLVNLNKIFLQPSDTVFIQNENANSLSGSRGTINKGTIKRNIQNHNTDNYQFESEKTFIKFNGTSSYPEWFAMSSYPDTNSYDFGSTWIEVPSTVDTINNVVTATGVTGTGFWAIGEADISGGDLIKTRVRRVYSSGSGTSSLLQKGTLNYTLSLRYDQSEVPSGAIESNFKLLKLVPVYSKANLKVFLTGPYSSESMLTTLNSSGYIPLSQPFNISPWNYNGGESVTSIPSQVVDWILLELRSTTTTVVARRACFVLSNGNVVDIDGINQVRFEGVNPGDYYIVVYHRNHLPVMSASSVTLTTNSVLYDFSTGLDKTYGTNAMKNLGSGVYGLISGDGNSSGNISSVDKNSVWRVQNGFSGYVNGDFNLSGAVTSSDLNAHWRVNNGATSQVP